MQRYFGFNVKVSDFLEPADYRLLRNRVVELLESRNLDLSQYRIYLHQLALYAETSHFGVGGGLMGRVEKIFLHFSINPKQRRSGEIKFINNLFDRELAEDVSHYYFEDEIGYTIPAAFFADRQWFQNILVTVVRTDTRESHRKIKVRVSVKPTPQFLEQLKREIYANSATILDIDFNKVVEFNKQTMLFMYDPSATSEVSMKDSKQSPRTVVNVNAPGNTVITDTQNATFNGPLTVFNNAALLEHLVQQLSTLTAQLKEKPQPDVPRKELAVVEGVIAEAPNNPEALSRIKELGKWVYTRAETIGLGLVIELLKGKLGI